MLTISNSCFPPQSSSAPVASSPELLTFWARPGPYSPNGPLSAINCDTTLTNNALRVEVQSDEAVKKS
jgi:hypothetical protein